MLRSLISISDAEAWDFRYPISDAGAQILDLRSPTFDAKAQTFDIRSPMLIFGSRSPKSVNITNSISNKC